MPRNKTRLRFCPSHGRIFFSVCSFTGPEYGPRDLGFHRSSVLDFELVRASLVASSWSASSRSNHLMDQRGSAAGPSSGLTAPLLARQVSRDHAAVPAPSNASTNLLRRTEAKAFFANERTFLHWMNMAVTTGSISAALLGVSGHAHKHWGSEYVKRAVSVRVLALLMMGISIGMACYAAYNFKKRGDMLVNKLDGPYDSRVLPVVLTVVMMLFLVVVWVGALVSYHNR